MHYNLNERLKPKRHTPVKRIVVIALLAVLGLVLYFAATHYLLGNDSGGA